MPAALAHAILLVISALIGWLGLFITRHPEKPARFFSLGMLPANRLATAYGRALGWFYMIGGSLGILTFLIALAIDTLHAI
jgi:hypothetical protein